MLLVAIFLCAIGTTMVAAPSLFWRITEQWKSPGAEGPSRLYSISLRVGGVMLILGGIGAAVEQYLTGF